MPAFHRVIVMKGFGKPTCDKICILFRIVVVVICPIDSEKRPAVNADGLFTLDGHMTCTVRRHHISQTLFAQASLWVIRQIILADLIGILILVRIPRLICHIVSHARHRSRRTAGIKTRIRHQAKASRIRLVFRRKRDILSDGIARKPIQFIPVHESVLHIEKAHAIVCCNSLRIILRCMLANAMRHLMPENSGKLIFIQMQNAHESAIYADVICRIARCIEKIIPRHLPSKRKRIGFQHIIPFLRKRTHHTIHCHDIVLILIQSVCLYICQSISHLLLRVCSICHQCAQCRLIRCIDAKRLGGNGPSIRCRRTREWK